MNELIKTDIPFSCSASLNDPDEKDGMGPELAVAPTDKCDRFTDNTQHDTEHTADAPHMYGLKGRPALDTSIPNTEQSKALTRFTSCTLNHTRHTGKYCFWNSLGWYNM